MAVRILRCGSERPASSASRICCLICSFGWHRLVSTGDKLQRSEQAYILSQHRANKLVKNGAPVLLDVLLQQDARQVWE
jgi:hypothetical protein